ncbi:Olfactory Receptor 14J1 [Manis pentadactyla]|nr:Olfactory Receptor 14J1 [Manis pentadactyla]
MQTLHGVLFLIAYLAALFRNGLIIIFITWDPQLHTLMYFFLKSLSLIDLCSISVTVPKFVLNSLMNRNTISFLGCVFQVLFLVAFACSEIAILTVMSYDHYIAVCHPLHYETIMNKGACFAAAEFAILTVMPYDHYMAVCHLLHYETIMNEGAYGRMMVSSYVTARIYGAMNTAATFSTTFSSNKIHHFFCDIPQIMLISDSKMNKNETSMTAFGSSISLLCLLLYHIPMCTSSLLFQVSPPWRAGPKPSPPAFLIWLL